ncbi:hypothetical protein FGIG_07693 [Fasciola gigantica]|uniref:Uncharacterized protein n=1 Tax=Fasciola gigantica TaxID=46835 RepID=A0A504Z420_FASGI|nr:hypothetical protein FGIG_07693 [Fasciola gigantica]
MPCDRQSIPWWTPLVISVAVCGSAITLKALYAVMGFIRRHRSYRATALSRNRFRSIQGASVDVELGGAIPITSRLSLDGPEDETDWDASDGFADADEMGSLIHSRFLLKPYRKSLAPTARLSDSEGANYLHRLSHTPQNRTDWNNFRGRTFGQTLPSMVSHDLSRFDNTHEQTWWTGLRQWFNAKHIGLTARQRLTMKLYCEQFTTVSYPAGKIMVSFFFSTTDLL